VATAGVTPRDPWFDNAKFALIALVVIGHTWTLLPKTTTDDWLYDFLYAWHVPAFVLVTGYLSRSFDWTDARMGNLFRTVVVPYVLFEALLAAFRVFVGHENLNDIWADPHWPMWYLAALFFWRMLTPIFKRVPLAVPLAVVVSLVAGAKAGDTLDMARVLGLLPFFVIGLKLRKEHFDRLHATWVRVAGLVVLAAIFAAARFTDQVISTEWLYYRSTYGELGQSDLESMLIRLVLIVIGTTGAFAFLSLVPPRHTWFTQLGSATLVVYLFHGFVVKSAEYLGFQDWASGHAVLSLLLATGSAFGLTVFLSLPRVAGFLHHAVDPIGGINLWRGRARAGHPHPEPPEQPQEQPPAEETNPTAPTSEPTH
jgi:fucose 4-O-acetylase-like acetyltransferase